MDIDHILTLIFITIWSCPGLMILFGLVRGLIRDICKNPTNLVYVLFVPIGIFLSLVGGPFVISGFLDVLEWPLTKSELTYIIYALPVIALLIVWFI